LYQLPEIIPEFIRVDNCCEAGRSSHRKHPRRSPRRRWGGLVRI